MLMARHPGGRLVHGTHSPGKHHEDVSTGHGRRPGAPRHFPHHRSWRDGGADGRVGLGQDDAHEHSRLPGPADLRPLLARWAGDERFNVQRAGRGADGETGVRLPELQLVAADHGHAERAHAIVLCPAPHGRRGSAAAGREPAGTRRACRTLRSRTVADVGRPAAAGGRRPLFDQSSRLAPGRRADGKPRFEDERGNPADVPATQCRGHHGSAGDARREGGGLRPSHYPHRRRGGRGR